MATNLKLDDHMVAEAVKIGGFKTKQQAVNTAIAEFVARRQRLKFYRKGTSRFRHRSVRRPATIG